MIKYLYKRDNKSKIRVVSLILTRYNTPDGEFYTITGESGQNGGKQVKRPLIRIEFGRASRTIEQQAILEYNSIINNYLDKGYKTQEQLGIVDINDAVEVESKVPNINLDQNGALKPMLAKHYKDIPNFDWNKTYYTSIKLDGELMPSLNSVNSVNSEMKIPSQLL